MEKLDAQLEQRVWQRVHGQEAELTLQPMAAMEQSMAATYRMLMGMTQGQERVHLRRLYESERRHGKILGGLHLLREGKPLSLRTVPLNGERPETVLRKCYAQTLQTIRNYNAHSTDPEHGHVFRALARQEEEHAQILLEILGTTMR